MERTVDLIIYDESGIRFKFKNPANKYDDCEFYKKYSVFKAVDFLTLNDNQSRLYLIEVKNFSGHEGESNCRERLNPRGSDPLHIEVAEKVRDTITVLYGASRNSEKKDVEDLKTFYEAMLGLGVKISVIAFVEGKLSGYSKGHKDGVFGLERFIKKHLEWLNCEVRVLNTDIVSDNSAIQKIMECEILNNG